MPTFPARRTALSPNPADVSHAGLLLTRYLTEQTDSSEHKERAVTDLFDAAWTGAAAARAVYELAFKRWDASHPTGCSAFDVTTDGRMIVGLGGHHVLETGLTLHHTYGVPYIPGAALKGLASHYCQTVRAHEADATGGCGHVFRPPVPSVEPDKPAGERNDPDHPWHRYRINAYRILFGTSDEAGLIRFHDAWLRPESVSGCLLDDVMTPHHGDYAMADEKAVPVPTDFDNPVPVAFLSVTGKFRVALSLDPSAAVGPEWLVMCRELVTAALGEWGVGGKTSSGYGRLVLVG